MSDRASNTSPPAPSGWQPIESAPKDGTAIVATDGKLTLVTSWVERAADHLFPNGIHCFGWRAGGSQPTHWMALPPAPGQNAKDALPPAPDGSPSLAHQLGSLLQESGLVPKFGLRGQGKYETVERMRSDGASWDQIGKAIGWSGRAVERHFKAEAEASPAKSGEELPVGWCNGDARRPHLTIEWMDCYTICTTCKRSLRYNTAAELAHMFNVTPPSWWPEKRIRKADASPAKDPIAAAVNAQLDPLKDELTAIGHKLAKETK